MSLILQLALLCFFCLTTVAQNEPSTVRRNLSHDTPAYQAAREFMRGANIANDLEVDPARHWNVPHTLLDLKEIRGQGFDHIRIPVAWHYYCGPGPRFQISPEIFARADYLVTNATAVGLNVIINLHNFNQFNSDPEANAPWFYAIWRQVAQHYASAPASVAFELLNEPNHQATTIRVNPIYAEAIREIRLTNPKRTLFVGPGKWNSPDELSNLRLPDNDDNLIVTLHCYDPMFFTHQGASWAGPGNRVTGIVFPGPPRVPLVPSSTNLSPEILARLHRYNTEPADQNPSSPAAFRAKVREARAWSEAQSRPVHFGEFGAYTKADQASRANYYRYAREALEKAGIGWAIWDWKSGFNYWNPKTHQPLPGMAAALFGEPDPDVIH